MGVLLYCYLSWGSSGSGLSVLQLACKSDSWKISLHSALIFEPLFLDFCGSSIGRHLKDKCCCSVCQLIGFSDGCSRGYL